MMKNFVNLLVYLISFGLLSSLINCEISDKRLCADPECKTLLSLAKTLVNYQAIEDGTLSFQINKDARVYSKSAGSNPDMWGVEIQGQRGYVNKKFLRENRVLKKNSEITEEVPTNLMELREKQSKRDEAKLKSSEPEDVAAEVTTTSPLPDQPAEKIVTDNADVNSSTERPIGSPVRGKIEVVDGTTVLIPTIEEPQNETGGEIVDNQVQDEDDEITVETESEEFASSEEVQEVPKSEEPIAEHTNASEGDPPAAEPIPQHINASQDDEQIPPFKPVPLSSAAFASAELKKQNPAQETSTPLSDDVRPVNEDVDETIQPDNKQPLEEQTNSTASPDSLEQPETADEESVPTASELPEIIPKEEVPESGNSISEPSLTQSEDHENQTGSDLQNIEEQSPVTTEEEKEEKTEKNETGTEELVPEVAVQENATETVAEEKLPEVAVKEEEKPSEVIPEVKADEAVTESVNPEQGSETHPTIAQSSEQLNQSNGEKLDHEHSHDQHHHHHEHDSSHQHDHDHAPESVIDHPQSDLLNLELTTASYEQEQYVPNPLHDDLTTTTSQPAVVKPADLQPEVVTEKSLPAVERQSQPEIAPPVVVDEPEKVDQSAPESLPSASESLPSASESPPSAPESVSSAPESVSSAPESVPSGQGSATLVEPVVQTEEKLPPPKQPVDEHSPTETKGLFDTILGTVNNFWPNSKTTEEKIDENFDVALEKLLFPDKTRGIEEQPKSDDGYCENLSPNACPTSPKYSRQSNGMNHPAAGQAGSKQPSNDTKVCLFENEFLTMIANKLLEMTDFIICLGITALTILIFTFGHYCISSGRKENALVSKLNIVERSLLTSTKESAILKHDLVETRNKLASIEDNSFGSNDMVIALRKDLEASEYEKDKLQEQVTGLEKELEHAAEAGLELNKIVSELLNNQSGDDSIISSVEELQKQLNEQQNTILEINTTLAEKSRENSELQMLIGEINAKFQEENEELKSQNEIVLNDRNELQVQVDNAKNILEAELSKMMAEKNIEIEKLVKDFAVQVAKYDDVYRKYQASEARVEALEDSLDSVKKNPNINMKDLLKATENKTEVLSVKKERDSLKERLEGEMDARKLLEGHVKIVSEEVSALKQEYNQSEKEKLEAQTRLEVLSSYFKEKEMQLQKELSVKEAMWMKQQGETTSTVERVRLMQDEIQALKSQNDSLRAEIEAQLAAHKAQIASLENRAHETWLASRQSDRKLEEARSEATALRRKLTSIAGNPLGNDTGLANRITNSIDGLPNHDLNQAPSPIHMESPGSPLLGGLPPPPPFLPPPFMGPPHPYMPLPPPFMPPGEMRPPPLGRLMSPPPPPPNRYSPSLVDRDRYSPENGRYSPDSRYNYNTDIISTYDTETDFSPPPSPHSRSRGGGGSYNSRERDRDRGNYKTFSPPPNSDRSKKTKGSCYSDSEDDGSDW